MSRRQYGIPYYVPIIDGYIKLDSLMRQHDNNKTPLSESRLMASIYIMDMVGEHTITFSVVRENWMRCLLPIPTIFPLQRRQESTLT